jgi:hypothetical protein
MTEIITIEEDSTPATKFLEPYLQSGNLNFLIGSGASFPAIGTAGNIESEINALLAANKEADANKKSLDFITAINSANVKIATRLTLDVKFKRVTKSYTDFLSTIDRILFSRKNILLTRQANVFTTNYDTFFEHTASRIPGIILNDGFDKTSSIKPAVFAPERYFDRTYRSGTFYSHQIEIPTINRIKLHGSLSWRKRSETVIIDSTPVPALSPTDQADPAKVTGYLTKHFVILPNIRKFHTTLMERVYYDLLRLYSRALDQPNAVLFSFGFSFSDEHLLDLTRRGLRNPTSHLIIFSYNENSTKDYHKKFSQHRNVTILSPDPASVLDFPRLNRILSSILPAKANALA